MLILGTHLNQKQSLLISLQALFGLNTTNALKICSLVGISPKVKLEKLRVNQLNKLMRICREEVDTSLIRYTQNDIQRLIQLKHYRGTRHMFGLPARGQRTRTNAQTSKKIKKYAFRAGYANPKLSEKTKNRK
uniref:ribosomal protein S13 n=1 Tax=Ulva meridionalis TaxID=434723 RepID=UPI002113C4BD|nr:ribosomal protein S13 [Ulva meridionalis]UTA96506.1 ribosomal protein S13 [Ulva meridionalis]UTA96566.1 ribosomal protein S13 [Ulva meridionalis]UTA96623.1 ribosomal protein S13 [Ulva meridionalis]UTA96675.1 ribosomal protein S13 [Ulva meridionalis]UTA96728.1 ribosomal protein S13 [Ulva meridionalis]